MDTAQAEIVKITDRAAKQLMKVKETEATTENSILRIGVKGGGCSGLSYILEYDEKTDDDYELNINGIDIIVDKRQALYLQGTVLDFKDGLDSRGFIFENPAATSTCGCGASFSA